MWPKIVINLQINLIYFLLLIPWPDTHVIKLFCSKDNSRLVRKIVRSKWTPILDKYQVKLPLECPLHPFRDLFAPREDAKKRDRPTQWTCRKCGKSFYAETFLDLHFETRHKSILNKDEDAVCLADLCDILRCEVFQSEESKSLTNHDPHMNTDIEVWGDSLGGQNSALAKANVAYLSLISLRIASSAASSRASKVQTNRQLCQHERSKDQQTKDEIVKAERTKTVTSDTIKKGSRHNGNNRSVGSASQTEKSEPYSKKDKSDAKWSGSNESNELKRIKNEESKHDDGHDNDDDDGDSDVDDDDDEGNDDRDNDDDKGSNNFDGKIKNKRKNSKDNKASSSSDSSATTNDTDNQTDDGTANMQKIRASCRVEELSKLRTKCEQLVRGCVAGSLFSMTDQAFREMEDEMNKAVCWYLSCERYWEDGPLEPRAFPWGLIIVLIFVLSMGICFCYYIIWILFDSEETTINANHQSYLQQQQQQQQQHQQKFVYQQGKIPNTVTPQHYYYQQPQQLQQPPPATAQPHNELYPEQARYDYRHSPRRYNERTHPPQSTPTIGGLHPKHHTSAPIHSSARSVAYVTDPYERRDFTNQSTIAATLPMATVAGGSSSSGGLPNTTGPYIHPLAGEETAANLVAGDGGTRHYNPNQHHIPLETHHRQIGASQTSLRGSSSAHEIVQSEVGHNEHYIYVTYPPDLKKRFFDKYD